MTTGATPTIGRACLELGKRPVRASVREDQEHGLVVVEEIDGSFASAAPEIAAVADRLLCAHHMNVARVHRTLRANGALHVVGEYVEGETYAELLRLSNGAIPFEARLRVLVDVLAGVAALHGDGVIHGALDASAVVVGSDGIARVVRTCQGPLGLDAIPRGERARLAPEVRRGARATEASDVHGVGALLADAVAQRGANGLPPWAAPLADLAARATRANPDERPRSAAEMAALVRMCARTKLASHNAVADAVREFATDHLLERRRRIDRSSGATRAAEAVTAFDADTAPKGLRTLPSQGDWTSEAPTLRKRLATAEEIDVEISDAPPEVASPSGDFSDVALAEERAPAPASERVDEAILGSTHRVPSFDGDAAPLAKRDSEPAPIAPRAVKRRAPLVAAIVAAAACAAAIVALFSMRAPRETAVAPLDSVRHERAEAPAIAPQPTLDPTPAPGGASSSDKAPQTPPSASAPKTPPAKRAPKPLRTPGQYDPTSI